MIETIDLALLSALNNFSQLSHTFDQFVVFIQHNHLFKGGVLIPIIYYVWFKSNQNSNKRKYLIAMLLFTFPAELIARLMAKTLPFRFRPIHDAEVNFLLPFGMNTNFLNNQSSFPSDHAVLFFCISVGILFCSKKLGIFAFVYTLFFIALPRIYLGLHYPSDVFVGALIGIIISILAIVYFSQNKLLNLINDWSYSKPEFFYPLFFLFTCQIFEMFGSARALITAIFNIL